MTPAQREALYLPATRALLDGWCGPVQVATPGQWCDAVSFGVQDEGDVYRITDTRGGIAYRDPAGIRLDLTRAEVCDRVVRVVGKNDRWTACGTPQLFGFLVGLECTDLVPDPKNDLIVYTNNKASCRPMLAEEAASLGSWASCC